ncbi:MAG: chromate transporter [Spirochaetes bacterium]|nr:chromate transporter [Spirochaetota bacterium]MBN2769409.1 chromate transporter [Spirochaetota bacterium]
MIYLLLFWTFFKIGAFSFGGGLAMIAPVQAEMEYYGWMSTDEFANIIAVSQITPGPIAVNTATYVGIKTAGFMGGLCATLGVSMPALIIMTLIGHFYKQYKDSVLFISVLALLKPVTLALIASAVVIVARTAFVSGNNYIAVPESINLGIDLVNIILSNFNLIPIIFCLVMIPLVLKFKLHPVLVIALSAVFGLIFL